MKTMLNIGEYARHKTTGQFGQVVAYGHEIIDSTYLATLKVEVVDDTEINKKMFVEDLTSNWMAINNEENLEYLISQKGRNEADKVLTRV